MNFELNLLDLPIERLFVKVKPSFIREVLASLKKKFSSNRKAYIYLGISEGVFYAWRRRGQYPLYALVRLVKVSGLNLEKIQENLVELKSGIYPPRDKAGGGISKPISPKFPIKLSKELARTVAHIFGDGCLGIHEHQYVTLAYYNQNKKLREMLKQDISNVFGFTAFSEGVNKTTPYVSAPSPIALILLHLVKSFHSRSCSIPVFIKNASREIKKEFIKAFFDDEAYVRFKKPYRYIELTLSNKQLLKDLKKLLEDFDVKTTKIYSKTLRGFKEYYFYIRHYHNLELFYENIGFCHNKKQEILSRILQSPGRKHYAHGETEEKIIALLNKGIPTSIEIGQNLDRKLCTVNLYLSKLEKENRIKRMGKKGRCIIWELRED